MGVKPKFFSKKQIEAAQAVTLSNRAAARYLGCSYQHYKKYAKAYGLFEGHLNQSGKGIPKFLSDKSDKFKVEDIIEGRVDPSSFDQNKLKYRMIESGHLKNECYICGFKEERLIDGKIPLILNFKDKNPRFWGNGNAELLCYNHYFLMAGDVFNEKDINQLESTKTYQGTSEAVNLGIDSYTRKRLQELGLGIEEKKESKYISRL